MNALVPTYGSGTGLEQLDWDKTFAGATKLRDQALVKAKEIFCTPGDTFKSSLGKLGTRAVGFVDQFFLSAYDGTTKSKYLKGIATVGMKLPGLLKAAGLVTIGAAATYSLCFGINKINSSVQIVTHSHPHPARHGIIYEGVTGALATTAGAAGLMGFAPLRLAPKLIPIIRASTLPLKLCALGSAALHNLAELAHNRHWLVNKSYWGPFSWLQHPANLFLSPFHGIHKILTHNLDEKLLGWAGIQREATSFEEAERKNIEFYEKKRKKEAEPPIHKSILNFLS